MTDRRPYSRVYWSVMSDEKFDGIREDMRHFGAWSLLLVVADMAYPAPAFVPPTVPKASLRALVDADLVDLVGRGMYRIRGLAKEREARSEVARGNATARWERVGPLSERIANGMRAHSGRTAGAMLDETKTRTSKDEDEHKAREVGPSTEETTVLTYLAKHGAYIRPESGFGQRIVQLVARRGGDAVMAQARELAKSGPLSDRQWVFGLEERLEGIPTLADARQADAAEAKAKREARTGVELQARRLDWFRNTGQWDPLFGPEPKWQPEWGERPKGVAA